ncbi:MAG: hypothetical protein HQL50_07470 [Magnetococcales bacterium]|nr:hypothetical protein [Magnetococcales bacterium]
MSESDHLEAIRQRRLAQQKANQRNAVVTFLILVAGFSLVVMTNQGGVSDKQESAERPQAEKENAAPPAGGASGEGGLSGLIAKVLGEEEPPPQKKSETKKKTAVVPPPKTAKAQGSGGNVEVEDIVLSSDWQFSGENPDRPVILTNIRVERGMMRGSRIRADLINRTEAALKDVIVAVYFHDRDGLPIDGKMFNPLMVSGGIFGDKLSPLKSGRKRTFGLTIDDAPANWGGEVTMELTHVGPGEPGGKLPELVLNHMQRSVGELE